LEINKEGELLGGYLCASRYQVPFEVIYKIGILNSSNTTVSDFVTDCQNSGASESKEIACKNPSLPIEINEADYFISTPIFPTTFDDVLAWG
jgi:hypothetical protein